MQTEENNPNLQINCNAFDDYNVALLVNPDSYTGSLATQGKADCTERADNLFYDATNSTNIHSYLNYTFDYYENKNNPYRAQRGGYSVINEFSNGNIVKDCDVQGNLIINCPVLCQDIDCIKQVSTGCVKCPVTINDGYARSELIRYFIKNGQLESALKLLKSFNDEVSEGILTSTYTSLGRYPEARERLAKIPNNKPENAEFHKLYNTKITGLETAQGNYYTMSDNDKQIIQEVSESSTQVSIHAQEILALIQGDAFHRTPERIRIADAGKTIDNESEQTIVEEFTSSETLTKSINPINSELLGNKPNPATNFTTIYYNLAGELLSAEIRIVNVFGIEVDKKLIAKENKAIDLDCSKYASGLYFYSLIVNGNLINTKKMVID